MISSFNKPFGFGLGGLPVDVEKINRNRKVLAPGETIVKHAKSGQVAASGTSKQFPPISSKPVTSPSVPHILPVGKPIPYEGEVHILPVGKPTPYEGEVHILPVGKPIPYEGEVHILPVGKPIPLVDPAQPVALVDPAQPVALVDPAQPVALVDPAQPVALVDPAQPVALVDPAEIWKGSGDQLPKKFPYPKTSPYPPLNISADSARVTAASEAQNRISPSVLFSGINLSV